MIILDVFDSRVKLGPEVAVMVFAEHGLVGGTADAF